MAFNRGVTKSPFTVNSQSPDLHVAYSDDYGDAGSFSNSAIAPLLSRATPAPGANISKFWKNVGAFLSVTLMIVSWIATAELVQGLSDEYNHPFIICYCTRLSWGLILFGWMAWRCVAVAPPRAKQGLSPFVGLFSWKQYFFLGTILSFIGFYSGFTWYISLEHTPLPPNTAIYQTAPVFVFMISVPTLGEKVTLTKVLATLVCVGGAALVSFGASGQNASTKYTHEGFGYVMCIASTLLYAIFEVLYKKWACSDDDTVKFANAFRFIGIIGITVLWQTPIYVLLEHVGGVASFEMPSRHAAMLIIINCVLDSVFNVSMLLAIMLTSPLFCSVATVLTLPASILGNVLLHKPVHMTGMTWGGCAMIIAGFLALTFATEGSGHETQAKATENKAVASDKQENR
eukprot:m.193357 g.193357  ORF g.193357 m.193357 type:complete len:402 (-) comp18633_c0_seq1:241-1446(-)